MANLFTDPQLLATAASDTQQINSAIGAAKAAAAGPTTGLAAAAADEVSAITASLFGSYGQEYQAVLQQAATFHDQFAAALAAAGNAYTAAEAANASAISAALGAISSPLQPLLGGGTAAPSALPYADPPSPLTGPTVDLVMGGSGLPIPTTKPGFIPGVLNYANQNFSPIAKTIPLFTPEGLYPLTGVKTLPLDQSVSQGVTILDSAIKTQLATPGVGSVSVSGYSQSAVISSLEMENLMNPALNPTPPLPTQLGFTLLGDPMNPNGGLLERFAGLTLPSLGLNFYGATPPNTPYPTHIYTLEYDGFADFPQYPINPVSDLNAFLGIAFVHGTYPTINPAALPPGYAIQQLPTSPGYTGVTTYNMITIPNLPLLDPVRAIPVIGNPIADLLQPDMTVLVNLGYGSTTQGWSTGYADVPTQFGVLPPVSPVTVAGALATGTQQGMAAFGSDMSAGVAGMPTVLNSLPTPTSLMASVATGGPSLLPAAVTAAQSLPDTVIQSLQTANTTIANAVSSGAANAYAVLLPTADIANAVAISVPSYDANLFLSGIEQTIGGDPVNGLVYAFGAPVAADMGLGTLAGGFELAVLLAAAGVPI
jgi:hypothetical protein